MVSARGIDGGKGQAVAAPLVLAVLSGAFLLWAFWSPRFRDAEGFLTVQWCLPVAVAVALGLLSWAVRVRSPAFGLWAGLLVVGQAAALQLLEAGSDIGYQHFAGFGESSGGGPSVALGVVIIQAVVVALGARRLIPGAINWLRDTFALWQITLLAGALAVTAAALSRSPAAYSAEVVLASAIQLLNLTTLILAVRAAPQSVLDRVRSVGRVEDGAQGRSGRFDWFPWVVALAVVFLAAGLNLLSYERHPHVPDEVVYLYHARYLASGMLTLPLPLVPEAVDIDLMLREADRWFSPLPPGWPAVLALGSFVKVPWLVNPILGGIGVLLAHRLVQTMYDRRTARMTVLLLAASPWYVYMAMSFMTHTLTLMLALLAAWALARLYRTGRARWGLLSGAAIGGVSLVRPLEGLALAGVFSIAALWLRGWRLRFLSVAALAVGAVIVGGLVLPYNAALTGDPLRFPIMEYTDQLYGPLSNALGFGPERGLGWTGLDPFPGHGLRDVIVNGFLNGYLVNIELFGWATGSLLFLSAVVLLGAVTRKDLLMVMAIAVIVGIHSFYWFSGGPDFGARYWFLIIIPCIVLTVRGVGVVQQRLGDGPGGMNRNGVVALAALLLSFAALVTYVPWRAVDKYHHYRGMRPDIRVLADIHDFGGSIVLVQGRRHPDYASAAIYNPLFFDAGGPIYAWDGSAEIRARLAAAYPDHDFWVVAGPTVTGGGFEVVAGPLTDAQLLEQVFGAR